MAISLALTRTVLPIGLVYAVDLVGAASGCPVVLALMSWVDGVSALFAVGAVGATASVCFGGAGLAWGLMRLSRTSIEPAAQVGHP
jgi:hypothetical protein